MHVTYNELPTRVIVKLNCLQTLLYKTYRPVQTEKVNAYASHWLKMSTVMSARDAFVPF